MKNKIVSIVTALLIGAVSFLQALPVKADYPTLVFDSWVTITTVSGPVVSNSINVTLKRLLSGIDLKIRNDGSANPTVNISLTQGDVIYSHNYSFEETPDSVTRLFTFLMQNEVHLAVGNVSLNVTLGPNLKAASDGATSIYFRAFGAADTSSSSVETLSTKYTNEYIVLTGAVQSLAGDNGQVKALIQINPSSSFNESTTANYSCGNITSTVYPNNVFGINVPIWMFPNGVYYWRAGIDGLQSGTHYGFVHTFVVDRKTLGNGNPNNGFQSFNGTSGNGSVTYPTNPTTPTFPTNPNTDPGNASGSNLGGLIRTYIDPNSITKTSVKTGADLWNFGFLDSSANISLWVWTTENKSDLVEYPASDGTNPIAVFINFGLSPGVEWRKILTGLTQNTTYHIQSVYRGDNDYNVAYTGQEILFTTQYSAQANPSPGTTGDTSSFPRNLLGNNPGNWWLACFVTMLFAFAICYQSSIMRVAAPLVVLAAFVVMNPSVFGWIVILGAGLLGVGTFKAFNRTGEIGG